MRNQRGISTISVLFDIILITTVLGYLGYKGYGIFLELEQKQIENNNRILRNQEIELNNQNRIANTQWLSAIAENQILKNKNQALENQIKAMTISQQQQAQQTQPAQNANYQGYIELNGRRTAINR
jgi:hypothetical protein